MEPLAQIDAPVLCCAPIAGNTLTPQEAKATADVFKALADPTRVGIVNLLAQNDSAVCVCDINAHFDLSQPTISHHLKKLTAAGVLDREGRGTWAYFSVNESFLETLSAVLQPRRKVDA